MTGRRVVLLRHAEAEPKRGKPDRERRLTKTGEAQAEAIGALLRARGLVPDAVVASPAPRAAETARLAAQAAGARGPVRFEEPLYEASPREVLGCVERNPAPTLWVVAHNPGLEEACVLLGDLPGGWALGKACAAAFEVDGAPLGRRTARLLALLAPP